MNFRKLIAWVVEFFTDLSSYIEAEKAKAILRQREQQGKAENERIAKAGRAADTVRTGGRVPEQDDPNNRDNIKR